MLDLDVRIFYKGRHTTQAREPGHVGEAEIITVNAARGESPGGAEHQWAIMPDVPRPDDCERVQLWPRRTAASHSGRARSKTAR